MRQPGTGDAVSGVDVTAGEGEADGAAVAAGAAGATEPQPVSRTVPNPRPSQRLMLIPTPDGRALFSGWTLRPMALLRRMSVAHDPALLDPVRVGGEDARAVGPDINDGQHRFAEFSGRRPVVDVQPEQAVLETLRQLFDP